MFAHFPRRVTAHFRQEMLRLYPALDYHERAAAYRRIAEYLLFGTWQERDEGEGEDEGEDEDEGHQRFHRYPGHDRYPGYDPDAGSTPEERLIIPASHLRQLVGQFQAARWFRAIDWLESFSRDVWPLEIHPHNVLKGRARSVDRKLPDPVRQLLEQEPIRLRPEDSVWFVEGTVVGQARYYAQARGYLDQIRQMADGGMDPQHPAYALMHYLNDQPPQKLRQLVWQNGEEVVALFEAMPTTTDHERARKDAARRTLMAVHNLTQMVYRGGPGSTRLYTIGPTLHGLPRHLRKALLRGCVFLDARACQLAIVARLWGIPSLQRRLESGESIWNELIAAAEAHPDDKPLLKSAVYGIIFGMARANVVRLLEGNADSPGSGLGQYRAVSFLQHPIVDELLTARNDRLRQVRREKFVVDAFGQRIDYHPRWRKLRSLMAQQVQSYEVLLMLSLLPVFQSERDLNAVSWLHDGIAIWVPPAKQERIVGRLRRSFDARARSHGIATWLDVE